MSIEKEKAPSIMGLLQDAWGWSRAQSSNGRNLSNGSNPAVRSHQQINLQPESVGLSTAIGASALN